MVFCGVWDEWFLAWSVPGCLTLTNDGYHFGLEGMLWVAEILEENAISTSTYFLPFFEFPGNNFLINCHYECWVAFREAPSCTRWIYFPCLDEFQCGQLLCMGRLKMISNSTIVIFWYISGLGEPVFYFFFIASRCSSDASVFLVSTFPNVTAMLWGAVFLPFECNIQVN